MTSAKTHDPTGAGLSNDLARSGNPIRAKDSSIVGEAIKDMLELLGAEVVGPAATTTEAERLLSEHAPDVALVDVHLRGGELSYGLIARLHEQGVPVILVSGSSEFLLPLLPVEAATILEKPFSEEQLLAKVVPAACAEVAPVRARPPLVAPSLRLIWPSGPRPQRKHDHHTSLSSRTRAHRSMRRQISVR